VDRAVWFSAGTFMVRDNGFAQQAGRCVIGATAFLRFSLNFTVMWPRNATKFVAVERE
jgi:hypothetical protein